MTDDERAIRGLIAEWMDAGKRGDTATALGLMTDDVVFQVPGRAFGKAEFAAASQGMKDIKMEAQSSVEEIEVAGPWAWCRTRLAVTVTPPNGGPVRRSGYTLSIFRKNAEGRWQLARDANLLAVEP